MWKGQVPASESSFTAEMILFVCSTFVLPPDGATTMHNSTFRARKLGALVTLSSTLAMPALAQSSVTLYGVLDVSLESVDGIDRTTRITSGNLNTSRLGFRGIED